VVVDLFRGKSSLRKKEVDDACDRRLGEKPPGATYSRIMKEIAYSSGGQWIFKKGNGLDS
jgi:hypothetical protein